MIGQNSSLLLTLCMLGNFSYFVVVCYFFKFNFIKKHYQSVKQFESRSKDSTQRFESRLKVSTLSVLIWVQTVCKGYHQMTKLFAYKKRVNIVKE